MQYGRVDLASFVHALLVLKSGIGHAGGLVHPALPGRSSADLMIAVSTS